MKKLLFIYFLLIPLPVICAQVLGSVIGNNNKNVDGKIRSDNNFIDKNNYKKVKPANINTVDTYLLQINNLHIPMDNKGVLANVHAGGINEGQIDGKGFLFSGGFMMSGKKNGVLWSNGVATSSRLYDYLPGVVGADTGDTKAHLYIVNSHDEPFGDSWQEWADAVNLGAYFFDGDGDGIYNPVDKNENGKWDLDEDMPDLMGDETVWCVYNDEVGSSLRFLSDQSPLGIEIRQTIWGYAESGDLHNMLFIRYSINNTGTVADVLDSVFFGVWSNADLGGHEGYTDDLVGCDTLLGAGYTYNDGPDPLFGDDPPCFLVDLLQGPWIETGNLNNTAYNSKAPLLGTETILGAENLGLTSFVHYMQALYPLSDPDNAQQVRNLLLAKNLKGSFTDPCNWEYGEVVGGVECSSIDSKFMYSGNPVALYGWLDSYPTDQRQMLNSGPFKLEKNKPVDIVAAYIVGRSTSALNSVTLAKRIDSTAQSVFDTTTTNTEVKHLNNNTPHAYKLYQNYPNPFNPTTTIRYRIPETGLVKLKVYDILGREVATLVNEEKTAGTYEIEFDSHSGEARNLTSGVYFYQLSAGDFVETKKMILMR